MKHKSKRIKRFISGKKIMILLYITLFVLIIALLIQTKLVSNPLDKFNKTIEKREITDICSVLGGKLIHSIKDEESCRNICVAECDSLNGQTKKSEFYEGQNSCNKCNCYCLV